ncbi:MULTISPECIES: 2-isopropylmalate synthase [Bordetella]|uniref:2-isopropylmalate synthase n=5 Tax=Bordetella TaxID=517 RepID=K0MPL1_BORPB|nr:MULTISPECIES: 2-isopropylmalate synthase [Bordetella]SHP85239.1 2-isopropylmalate synthase [Mycobacteroides abscessus subsp. abscessus]AMG86545.1 2-isopropylmalate synthase [Bordetella bronchiseptica]AWP77383.1 2-isopropylmalate synthase [Bordetella bronchiseptica]AWP82246.1 2-isopropylmalate synthase [Bordetella bronchiseptica]AWP87041.1 2-isopropylmalate synthase [Bordetella bronchiseptica]
MMLANPATKYVPFQPFARDFAERTWPSRRITQPPIWMSTDLRDGNQSLIEPMSVERKVRFFEQLVKIGFKEIEVGFPSASQTDFDFVRKLIDEKRIPDDVTIIVLTQSREDLISRTVEAAAGARQAMIHLYNACAPAFRKIVFNMSRDEIKNIAVTGTRMVKQYMAKYPQTQWRYEYSPEVFSTTEPEFALDVSNAVADEWDATPQRKMVLNLPATIEATSPNMYADQIEWMHKNLARRDSIVLSVHPHNDRGTAVAAAEFAVMAGADRIEGCLFGSGERTGNVDLVTLALNLYTQGVHPGLDFSDIDEVRRCAEYCNQLPVHPRHPYAGDLVFTAFSGSHQDAIKKGFAQQQADAPWEVPYLPIDPADLGRSYDAVIRVNSQSGKGGVSYLLEQEHGLVLPRRLQIEFSRAIQRVTDETGREVSSDDVYTIFDSEYLAQQQPWQLVRHRIDGDPSAGEGKHFSIEAELSFNGERRIVKGSGDGAISAFVAALDVPVRIMDYHEHAIGTGTDTRAACYVEVRVGDSPTGFGVGIDRDIVTASFKAVLGAVNRHHVAATQATETEAVAA